MPSFLHESAIDLIRRQPEFVADLLGRLLHVRVPRFTEASKVDTNFSQVVPIEFRADAVVLFTLDSRRVFGVIVEVQLQPDGDKLFSWPVYATVARADKRCPFAVLVMTADLATARWAERPIELGGHNVFRPLVVGPDGVPKVTDADEASRHLHFAMLSALVYGKGDEATAAAIGIAVARAIQRLPEDQRKVYSPMLDAALSPAARKAITMEIGLETFFTDEYKQAKAEGREQGRAEGRAEATVSLLLKLLSHRGLKPTEAQQREIEACTDLATLDRWADLVLSVNSVDELLGAP